MKRKITESFETSLKIDVVNLSDNFSGISIDELADQLMNATNADITKEEQDGTVYMVINGVDEETIVDEITDFLFNESDYDDIEDVRDIVNDSILAYDEFSELEEGYDYDDDDMFFDDSDEYPDYEDVDDIEDDEYYQEFPDYDDIDVEDDRDINDYYDDAYESEEYDDDDMLNDELEECGDSDEFDECENIEDKEFECYESRNYRYLGNGIYEKKKGCCPPKRKNRMVNLSESLKARKFKKLSLRQLVESAKRNRLNESVYKKALRKARTEKPNLKKMIKESLGAEKYNFIVKSLRNGKKTLYENKKINGKSISKYSSKALYNLLRQLTEKKNMLQKKLRTLNESRSTRTLKSIKALEEDLKKKLRLINLLDEELTYRLTVKKMLKEQDEENPLEPLSVDPTGKDDNPEEDEEVELSRVVITVANQDAADELKSSLVDAGIPDDAIEFESDEDIEAEDEESDEAEDEESDEESADDTAKEGENKNESLYYKKFRKLLEDDTEETNDEANAEDSEEDSTEDSEEDSEDDTSDEPVKVVLTNTDYINDLADVLNDEYGISKEEFEEMIGGEIVDDSESDDSKDDDDSKDEDSKDDKEKSSKGDEAIDAMTPEDLNDLFGDN